MDYGIKWDQMPWEEVNENISRKVVIKKRMMMILYRFRTNLEWPEEKHEAEQGGYIIKGKALLRLPGEKQEIILGPGDGYLIDSNKRHSWKMLEEEVLLVDFFSPPRRELMEQKYAPNATNSDE